MYIVGGKVGLGDFIFQKLSCYLKHTPTECQERLFTNFAAYITSNNNNELFVVNGYAGTGKTTAVGAIVKLLEEMKIKVVLMAPTGRAAKVLSGYTQKPAYTIHKTIYRDKNRGGMSAHFVLNTNMNRDTLFIVDEASLIANQSSESSPFGSGRLLDDLVEYVRSGVGNRLFLLGDAAQLPPIGITLSPALDSKVLSAFGPFCYVEMTTVVRQAADSGILHNATLLRKKINAGKEGLPALAIKQFPDIHHIGGEALLEVLSEAYDRYGMEET
ncbi:MAG: AAA family ATPase, partial [Prevotellaceae bacterium]|nr:AAA family ATPase [Prevotellaceae bacterium]